MRAKEISLRKINWLLALMLLAEFIHFASLKKQVSTSLSSLQGMKVDFI
jgi:hypothetical protein